jgi:4-diphosphocytidyl-2-C-methyl-D-erythritol kinase
VSELFEKAPAKINLTLRVLGRRDDGYHELESLVAFAGLADKLTLEPGESASLEITGRFAAASGTAEGNLVLKAVSALRQRVGPVRSGRFLLEKNIPVAAGLGGGSADAGAALRLLAGVNDLALDDPRLAAAAVAVGADVPVCLDPRPRIMRGLGDLLSEPLKLPRLAAVFANPGVPLPTRDVFDKFAGADGSKKYINYVPSRHEAMLMFLAEHENDLTHAAIACAPVVAEVMIALRALPAVRLVRMAGSGPTCFALFASQGEADAAAERLQFENKDWWVCATPIG